jgi:glycogen operon protein
LADAPPLGAGFVDGGVNFSLFSRTASGVDVLFFDREDDSTPSRVFQIDPATNRTYHYWHVSVPGVLPGQIDGYRAAGPSGERLTLAITSSTSGFPSRAAP